MNKYFWRYQRYELVREYFEKPMFAYPPLSLLIYILMFIKYLNRGHTRFRVFSKWLIIYSVNRLLHLERLATTKMDKDWTDFEDAATYEYARGLVEEKYRPRSKIEKT